MGNKVVILGSAHPLRGGLATYNERLCKAFNDAGHQARIETFKLQYPKFLFPGKTQYSDATAPKDIKIDISLNSINPLNWIKVGEKLKKEKPDILIIKYWLPFMAPCFGSVARIVKKNKHTKIVSILDNIIPHEKRFGDKLLTKYFVKPIDGFVAMSKSVLKDLEIFDTKKPRIFNPHPLYDNFGDIIDKKTARNSLNIEENTNLILFFGLIRDYKGLDILLNALSKPILDNKNIKLIVAGEFYSSSSEYYKIVENHNLKNKVSFSNNFVPDDEVAKYFCAADLVVQPYKTATQSGVSQIAYHFNIPMIVTNVGGLPELVPNEVCGYVVEPDDMQVANAINKFFSENKFSEFSKNIEKEKLKYSWESMINAIKSLIS